MHQAGERPAPRARAFVSWAFLLVFLACLWPAYAPAAPSNLCPTLSATVAHGGSIAISVSSCDGVFDGGMSGPIAPFALHGTVSIGQNAVGVQNVTYAHNGNSATSDTFALEDNALGVVTVNITITPPATSIVVSPSPLPPLVAGSAFAQSLSSTGGVGPYAYSVVDGTLPTGLALTPTGSLSGTPTRRGVFSFSVRSQDSVGAFAVSAFAGTVQNPSLVLAPAAATAVQGVAFSQAITPTGGVGPYTFALESGSLPAGITLSSGGLLAGTTSATAGAYALSLRVTDSSTGTGTYFELEPFTLTVVAPPSVTITVSPSTVLENGAGNLVYTVTRSASLNAATVVNLTTTGTATAGVDYTGAVASVSIPSGATTATVTIDPSPDSTVEPDETVTITVAAGTGYSVGSPASATGTILNDDVAVAISPASLPGASLGVAYSQTLAGSGGTGPYTFTVSAGALPTGLVLGTGGALGGVPTATGDFNFTVSATDASAFPGPYTGTRSYLVAVTIPATTSTLSALALSSGTLSPAFAPGTTAYTAQVPNGTASITVTPTATDPQATIQVNGVAVASGAASGPIALAVGANAITVAVTSRDASATTPYSVTVTRAKATQAIVFGVAPSIVVGSSGTVSATGGGSGNPVVITTQTPAACTIAGNVVTGVAEGTCTLAANQAGNAEFEAAPQATLSFTVAAPPSVTIAVSPSSVVENGAGNLVYTVTRSASLNAATVVNLTTTGTATAGVDYTGAVASVSIPAGATTATVTIDPSPDSTPEPDETVTITVAAGTGYSVGSPASATGTILNDDVTVAISPASLPGASLGVAYSQTLTGSGGTGPYTFTVSAGALPTGLVLGPGGVLGGVPTATGDFNFTVSATDASAFPGPYTGTRSYLVAVTATSTLSALALSSGTLSPAFAPGTTAYTAQVPNGTASITVTPTATDPQATIQVNGVAVASGAASAPVALAVGANAITVAVTSRDASATTPYSVTVTRAKATQAIVFGVAPSIVVGSSGTVSATGGGSGNPVVITTQTPAACTIAGNVVTGVAEGTCTLAANQAGNAEFEAAPQATLSFTVLPASSIPRLANISTRAQVLRGNEVLIAGFIIGGGQPKTVMVRARGPSLAGFGIANPLANPLLQLFSGASQIAFNDNWRDAANQPDVVASGFAPGDDVEAAILVTLAPGPYTAIVTGADGGTGVGIVEVFEVDLPQVPLVNISTRGTVQTGNDVMIGGFIITGDQPQTVIIRARGPSLADAGVPGVLANPFLQLFAGGVQMAMNDNWQDGPDAAAIQAAGFAPGNALESAIRITLAPGAYSAIVTGVGAVTGVAIVEVFAIP